MRNTKWCRIALAGIVSILLVVATAGCKTREQIEDEKARERLPSLVGITVSPIRAVFDQRAFTTTYRVEADGLPADSYFVADWSGPNCGNWSVIDTDQAENYFGTSEYAFRWYHPHPPCPETTDHADITVRLVLSLRTFGDDLTKNAGTKILLAYRGSETGTGPNPTWQER